MTSTTFSPTDPTASNVPATKTKTGILKWLIQKLEDYKETQRTYQELSRLDDHALRDVGIRREDIAYLARHGRLPND